MYLAVSNYNTIYCRMYSMYINMDLESEINNTIQNKK